MTTAMISNLPKDLLEEILSKLPFNSMKAVCLTCKTWNDLSKTESFAKMHICKATRCTFVYDDRDDTSQSLSNEQLQHKCQLRFLNNQVSIYRVFHYEGLVLCILKDVTRIVIWNPFLRQTRWIKLRFSHRTDVWDTFRYALGYEVKGSCRSVKFLRFLDYFSHQFFWYEIYDFDSGLWRSLDVTPYWCIYCAATSVSLKGNTYWCAKERNMSIESYIKHIICFDFTSERFGPLLPLPMVNSEEHNYNNVTLSCVKEEKLAVLFQSEDSEESQFEIWITTKIDVETVSWIKFLRMDKSPWISIAGSFFIDEEKNVLMSFGTQYYNKCTIRKRSVNIVGEDGYVRKLDPGVPIEGLCRPDVCCYVPSLIQVIKKPVGGKRIEQSSLENRRFDQSMLRLAALEKLLKKKQQGYW
ncbi:hypothetical protein CARUB_v10024649mg [Capsella rubella]|uniref:F-box domain-containing protein n=1 Tax=Capsella rubella TaxID=81985 RepID=R0FZB7_9BRAS|nr:hypothetical protein CARUB_v10024649mg [Capsella rubella]